MLFVGKNSRQGRERDIWNADKLEDQADYLKMTGGGGSLLAKMYQAPSVRHWWLKVCVGHSSVSPGAGLPKSQG